MKHRLIPCVMIQPDSLHPLLPSPTAHGVHTGFFMFFLFFINIAYKCSLCLNCLQKLNGVCKSPSNIPTWAFEFIPGSAGTEAIESPTDYEQDCCGVAWGKYILSSSLTELLGFTAWVEQIENAGTTTVAMM